MAKSELDSTHSSADEEEEVSSEGSESESEPEKTPPPPPSSRKTLATPDSSSDGSGSESDSDAGKADPNIKPLATKPMDDEPLKNPRRKNPTSRYSPPPLKSVTGKRPAAKGKSESGESKRAKTKVVVGMAAPDKDGQKTQLFQRLWSEDDEIELLKGMINYVEKKGRNPIHDVNDFHEFVINSLNVDVNISQMYAKVKRIKAKFMKNVGKIENKGKVRSFSKPHERNMYELSKQLWGSDSNKKAVHADRSTKKVNVTPNRDRKPVVLDNKYANEGLGVIQFPITEEGIMKKGLELLSGSKKVELEEKWKNLKVQELEHFLKKLEMMKEQTELVLNAIKKSGAN